MWDFSIQSDHVIEARRTDLVVVDKKKRTCKIINFVFPGDSRIEEKEKDEIEKYEDLGRELQKIWNLKVKIMLFVVSSSGAIPKQFGNRLNRLVLQQGQRKFKKRFYLERLEYWERFLKSNLAGCGGFQQYFQYSFTVC